MEEISRPTKTMRSSTEQVISIMPTAPKRVRAKYSPAWLALPSKKSNEPRRVTRTTEAMTKWKRMEKASTWMVPEKAWRVPSWIWYQLAAMEATVPAMASQPSGLRLELGFRHGSARMARAPTGGRG